MKDGKVVALKVEHYSNAGNTMDLSQSVSMGTPASWGWGYHSNAGNTIDLGVSMGTAASRGWGVPGKSRAAPQPPWLGPPQFLPVTMMVASPLVPTRGFSTLGSSLKHKDNHITF